MKHIGTFAGLVLSLTAALSMAAPAFAADYSFTATAPQDYYGSTSYEDVYGSPYNYCGRNVADYRAPELEYGVQSTTMTGVMERASPAFSRPLERAEAAMVWLAVAAPSRYSPRPPAPAGQL